MWNIFQQMLHGLARFGVWLLNVLVYESITTMMWLLICYFVEKRFGFDDKRSDCIMKRSAIILFAVFVSASIACCFGWLRIIPLLSSKKE